MGGQDDDLDAPGDQVFDVGSFFGGVAFTEEDLDLVTGLVKGFLETGLILDPARFFTGWQNNANGPGGYFGRLFSFFFGWFFNFFFRRLFSFFFRRRFGFLFCGWRFSWFFCGVSTTGCQGKGQLL